jgi:hypothetical protein
MLKALCAGGKSAPFDPPLVLDEKHYGLRDYWRPMQGGAAYAALECLLISPLLLTGNIVALWIFTAIAAFIVLETMLIIGVSAGIHHRVFVHRLRKYGPAYYNSEITVDAPQAEAFELCLAATSDLPKSKIVSMDEKEGTLLVTLKGNFWTTVDRQVRLKVRGSKESHLQSIISVDPSVKLTPFRRKIMRLVWGDKWYPLIFRSDVNWNRKILNSVTTYIESVPNWDHRYDHPEIVDHGFLEEMNAA